MNDRILVFIKSNKNKNIKIENIEIKENLFKNLEIELKKEFKKNENIKIIFNKYYNLIYIEKINTNKYYYVYMNYNNLFDNVYNTILKTLYENNLIIENKKINNKF